MFYKISGNTSPTAQTVVLSSGLGGVHSFWKPQLAMLEQHFRVVVYDQFGTGASQGTIPAGYRMEDMADELAGLLNTLKIDRCHVVGHALGGIIGLHLAQRYPALLESLVVINGWATLDSQTRRCFQVRQDLLLNTGVEAYVRAQPLFLYPADWLSAHAELLEQEQTHQVEHFQGMENLLHRLQALMSSDLSGSLDILNTPTLAFSCKDDLLVPWHCSTTLAHNLPNGELVQMSYGGHAMSVTDSETFNPILLEWLLRFAPPSAESSQPTETSWPKH
ncbi:pyrimidine utilization protein D [Rouxiella badensis]|uniref:Putative carbamate hydrolase RutD n=1 Tax=Rouxiella badensis TaxID=1646377 RepID=A0A1X0WBX9_9GAMM|nr:pyrimidine utilization protein D [Rouxiella badensis]MCC3701186.1 pyrimidine utilization protein D [Rouxiella badensis]MCC3745877.1 pyrimidine utilization protein D [Rouxiella badensis]ORJ24274.1 pyrimidine utilization protein D [Rouxiella badensis]QOI57824.1 pyrimidine utilization protein D [Rouxiella badensis subsp. acadiensis]WAT11282.1 pyrimidine utilization protein D [Rouxiella badensis]